MIAWLLWTMVGMTATPPTLLLKTDGSVMSTPLGSWRVHSGEVAVLRDPHQPDSFDSDELEKSLAQGTGWQDALVPVIFDAAVRDSERPTDVAGWWAITQLDVSEQAVHRTSILWLAISDTLLDVYVNGNRIGTHGDHDRDAVMLRSPVPTAYVIPANMLHADKTNTIVLAGWNPILNTRLDEAEVIDLADVGARVFWRSTVPLMLNVGVAVLLLAIAAYSLLWYLRRPEEHENVFLVAGTVGWTVCFATSWMPWVFHDGGVTLTLAAVGLSSANFLAVFFQQRYKIHASRIWPYAAAAMTALTAIACVVLGDVPGIMKIVLLVIPAALVSFLYALYLNVQAVRAGNREARMVVWGYVLFVAGVGTDMIFMLQLRVGSNVFSSIGIAGLATTILLSLTTRFSTLHESSNEFVERLRRKQDVQDYLIHQIAEVASAIEVASQHIVTSASQQQLGATEQSTAVEETRRTMEALSSSGRNITTAATDVLKNAEMTQQHNHAVAERIAESSTHSRRISEILDIIRDIANKSELLALNAALEGSRAGEAGRGFALVASQMQRLAENVMSAVSDIKDLTSDIRTASASTETSTLQAATLASETTDSVHKIGLIIQEQQAGTEQVTRAMDDVAKIAQQTAHSGQTTLERTQVLLERATSLRGLVEQYRSGKSP